MSGFSQRNESTTPEEAFRVHRHGVLNELQMVKAYLQMDQSQRALGWLDRLAEWLMSLALWQNRLSAENNSLLWVAAQCPHVILQSIWDKPVILSDSVQNTVADVWKWLDNLAGIHGIQEWHVEVCSAVSKGDASDLIEILVHGPFDPSTDESPGIAKDEGVRIRFIPK